MKKSKKIFIAVVLCALVLLSVIPASALRIPPDRDYTYTYGFAGIVGSAPSNSVKICEFKEGVKVTTADGSYTTTVTFFDVWLETDGTINFFSDNYHFYYSPSTGSIHIDGRTVSMVFIYADYLNVNDEPYFKFIFIETYEDATQSGYYRGYQAGVADGYEEGYSDGYAEGQAAAAEGDFKDGYDAALNYFGKQGVKNLFSFLDLRLSWFVGDTEHRVMTRPDVNGKTITFETAASDLEKYCTENGLAVPPNPVMTFLFHENIEENQVVMTFLFTDFLLVVENGFPPDSNVSNLNMWIRYTQSSAEYPDETYNPIGLTTVDGVTGFRGSSAPLNVYSFWIVSDFSYPLADLVFSTETLVSNAGYRDGYAAGFTAGFNSNAEETSPLIDEAYDRGYNMGYQEGKGDGIALADTDFFDLCFAVAQAPLDVLYGVFDFEILGFNMQTAVGSLATVCIVVFLVKFLLFFLS